ncbi:MAG: CDC27 family protein [Planctomycetota bacterium]|nr:CDC27 family protein [Planctomycetota bacterium]MDI6788114.1 CDC27 family protein [Planctomycetota bacterium]
MKETPNDRDIFRRFEINLYEAALKSNPNNLNALRSLGYIYSQEKLHDRAVEIDKRIVRLLPDESLAHYNLACSCSQLNQIEDALNEIEMAILLGYSNWEHMEKDEDLENLRKDPRYQQFISSRKKKFIV